MVLTPLDYGPWVIVLPLPDLWISIVCFSLLFAFLMKLLASIMQCCVLMHHSLLQPLLIVACLLHLCAWFIWSCSQNEHAIDAVHCKKGGLLL